MSEESTKNRSIKTVSFATDDPHEMELLKFAQGKKVFSRYIKRLIAQDMMGLLGSPHPGRRIAQPAPIVEDDDADPESDDPEEEEEVVVDADERRKRDNALRMI